MLGIHFLEQKERKFQKKNQFQFNKEVLSLKFDNNNKKWLFLEIVTKRMKD
jgi:hypothetical protein